MTHYRIRLEDKNALYKVWVLTEITEQGEKLISTHESKRNALLAYGWRYMTKGKGVILIPEGENKAEGKKE